MFFLHLTVSHSTHRGVWADTLLGRHIPLGRPPPRYNPPPSRHAHGQTPPRHNPPSRHAHGQTPPWADTTIGRQPTPPRRPLQKTVRILLECILVCTNKILRIRKQKQNKTRYKTRGVGALHSGFFVSY